jgi:O-antigen/teichoic acid export membrane protein
MASAEESTRVSISPSIYGRMKQPIGALLLGETLRAKVFRGGAWLGGGSLAEQVVRFGRNMLLTRLLAPEAFGTMAIISSATSLVSSFTAIGVREALIQNPRGGEPEYVGAAWWLGLGRAVSTYVLVFLAAPFVARFYGNPQLTSLLRVAVVAILFEGAFSPRATVALKEMKFLRWAAVNHGGGICGVVLTVILSYFIRDVWALAIGYSGEGAARCLLSHLFFPYLPSLRWDKGALRQLLTFSRGVFGLSFFNLIFARADIFVLAKLYSASELGLYAMAVYLVQVPTGFIMNLLGQTLLPAYSRVQGHNARVNRILLQVTGLLIFLGLPALAFSFFCGRSLLTVVYGPRYAAAAAPLIVGACVALFNLLNGQITTVFFAKGVPSLHRRSVALMAVAMVVLVYPFSKWLGIVGGQAASLIAVLLGYLFQVERIYHLTGVDLPQYGKSFLVSAATSFSVVAICLATRPFASLGRPLPNIGLGIAGCILAYALACLFLFRDARSVA